LWRTLRKSGSPTKPVGRKVTMIYSNGFRARMVRRMAGAERISASMWAKEVGVTQPTLSRWLRDARSVEGMGKRKSKSAQQAADGLAAPRSLHPNYAELGIARSRCPDHSEAPESGEIARHAPAATSPWNRPTCWCCSTCFSFEELRELLDRLGSSCEHELSKSSPETAGVNAGNGESVPVCDHIPSRSATCHREQAGSPRQASVDGGMDFA